MGSGQDQPTWAIPLIQNGSVIITIKDRSADAYAWVCTKVQVIGRFPIKLLQKSYSVKN